jgi:tetratricopeptide (TPR) repeat protein
MDKLQKAIDLTNQGELEKAKIVFEEILQENPDNVDVLYNFGLYFIKLREPTHAIVALSRSLSLDDQRVSTYIALGDAFLLLDDPKEAKKHLITALNIEVDNPYALRKLGVAYGKLGELANSAFCLKKASKINPEN